MPGWVQKRRRLFIELRLFLCVYEENKLDNKKKLEGYVYCVFNMRLKIIIKLVDIQVEAPPGAGVAS